MPIAKIDEMLCIGCGLCVDTCPEDVIRLDTDPLDAELRSPCAMGCPAGISVRRYSYFIEMGMMEEAITAFREYNPFPAITGRICPHHCEDECARCEVDEAVNINALERYMADYFAGENVEPVQTLYAAKVAVVGSGPSGLSCAYYLRKKGYHVTVFEKMPVLGGMLSVAIPDFRLPRAVVNDQIRYLTQMGVEFQCGVEVGKDITVSQLKEQGYGSVYVAIGLQNGGRLNVPGEDVQGVQAGVDFCKNIYLNNERPKLGHVVVIGGGNIGADVARVAMRNGAESVKLYCLEAYDAMPMGVGDRTECEHEGVEIHAGWGQTEIFSQEGKCSGISFRKCLRVQKNGIFDPEFDDAVTETVVCDTVLYCIGQRPQWDNLLTGTGVTLSARGFAQAHNVTYQSADACVFVGGDVFTGQKFCVDAIGAGREAAESIDRYLHGKDLKEGRYDDIRVRNAPKDGVQPFKRQNPANGDVFTENEARLEAQRCMTCGSRAKIRYADDCMVCLYCEKECPQHAIYVSPERNSYRIAPWDLA